MRHHSRKFSTHASGGVASEFICFADGLHTDAFSEALLLAARPAEAVYARGAGTPTRSLLQSGALRHTLRVPRCARRERR
jgi:hypothetical protein